MAYRLRLNRPLSREVRRVGLEQIDRALGELERGEGRHRSVHQARKCVKRVRALLRLARPAIGNEAFKIHNRRFRDIGRGLSGARDKQAMIECVTKLQMRYGLEWSVPAVAAVKSWLYEERRRAESRLANGTRGSALATLSEARAEFAALEAKGDVDALMKGLRQCYTRGRRTLEIAYASNVDESFHEWRKWTQQHWRHMQLLLPAWPEVMAARFEAASELSELLGDDHDLHVLIGLVRENGPDLAGEAHIAAFLEGGRARQHELRAAARPRGARLFAEAGEPFCQRITAYWLMAGRIAQSDDGSAEDGVSSDASLERPAFI